MEIKEVEKLKLWLLKKLEPLCDADPSALAKYVVALLRKEKPKDALKELCIDQLEVFLAKETTTFVNRLFRALDSECYLLGEDAKPPSPPPVEVTTPPAPPPPDKIVKTTVTVDPVPPPPPPPPGPPITNQPSGGDREPRQRGGDRRHSEDVRNNREVDDDDRDFRRSRRTGYEADGRKAPPLSSRGGGGDGRFGNRRRRVEPNGPSGSFGGAGWSGGGRDGVDGGGRGGGGGWRGREDDGGRRSVRDRLGPKVDERSDYRGRRSRRARSHSSDGDSDSSTGSAGRKRVRSSTAPSAGRAGDGGPAATGRKSQRCKNYDEKGFCILGEQCQYDHGNDPVVIGGSNPPPGHPFPPPPPQPPHLTVPILPPMPPLSLQNSGLLVPPVIPSRANDGYNPEDPSLATSKPPAFIPPPILPPPLPMRPGFPPPMPGPLLTHSGIGMPPPLGLPPPPPLPRPPLSSVTCLSTHSHPHPRPFPSIRLPQRASEALILRKVPRELNSITKLSAHFEKFGTIVNLTVRYEGDPEGALVQFSSPSEARSAHDSTEAVLNNRFIRIYYLRRDLAPFIPRLVETIVESPESLAVSQIHGRGQSHGSRMAGLPPPAPHQPAKTDSPTSTTLSTQGGPGPLSVEHKPRSNSTAVSPPPPSTPTPSYPLPPNTRPLSSTSHSMVNVGGARQSPRQQREVQQSSRVQSAEVTKKKLELHKRTQELLWKQIGQQKLLLGKLEKGGKHLSSEERAKIMTTLKALAVSITKLQSSAQKAAIAGKTTVDAARKKQEAGTVSSLKEKADALRKEAHMLGLISSPSQPLSPATPTPSTSGSAGGGFGRVKGHAEGDLRKRLDRRKILVVNATDRDKVTEYFESFGGLLQVEVDPANEKNLVFTFKHSSISSKVVKSGSVLDGKPLIMKWYVPPPLTATPSANPHVTTPTSIPGVSLLGQEKKFVARGPFSVSRRPKETTTLSETNITDDQGSVATPPTPVLAMPGPAHLHLVEDDEEEESEGRSWRR